MSGTIKVDGSGGVELKEEDGIDYAAVTVQLPGGERVPFLFSVKGLDAKVRVTAALGCRAVPAWGSMGGRFDTSSAAAGAEAGNYRQSCRRAAARALH